MKEKTEFEEYDSGFFHTRFNRLLRLIRKNRVLPIRPGWEQTPDGIVPPPVYVPESQTATSRPFQVTVEQDPDTSEVQASVNTGRYGFFGGPFAIPAWSGSSAFNTLETISSSSTLRLNLTISQSRVSVGAFPSISSQLAWETGSGSSTSISAIEHDVNFFTESVDTTDNPDTQYTVDLDIAYISISGSDYVLTQYVDYNILVPANLNRFYDITGSAS